MKYILNTGRYDVSFTIIRNNREAKVILNRRRLFIDTGNIAVDGINAVSEEDYKELTEIKQFNNLIKSGELTLLDEKEVKTGTADEAKALAEENKKLKKELEKAKKGQVDDEEKKALADENASLKAQLEALTKGKEEKEEF